MTHTDGIPGFSARSVRRGDAVHREAWTTMPESPGMPPFRSLMWPAGGCQKRLPMPRIASVLLPTRQITSAISIGHYYCSLV